MIADEVIALRTRRLFAFMRERGLFNDTMIVFTADHGEMLGAHGLVTASLVPPPPMEAKACALVITESRAFNDSFTTSCSRSGSALTARCSVSSVRPTWISSSMSCSVVDSGDHASILDGCLLSRAKLRPFRHNRMDKLERMLERAAGDGGGVLVVVDVVGVETGFLGQLAEDQEGACAREAPALRVEEELWAMPHVQERASPSKVAPE